MHMHMHTHILTYTQLFDVGKVWNTDLLETLELQNLVLNSLQVCMCAFDSLSNIVL